MNNTNLDLLKKNVSLDLNLLEIHTLLMALNNLPEERKELEKILRKPIMGMSIDDADWLKTVDLGETAEISRSAKTLLMMQLGHKLAECMSNNMKDDIGDILSMLKDEDVDAKVMNFDEFKKHLNEFINGEESDEFEELD